MRFAIWTNPGCEFMLEKPINCLESEPMLTVPGIPRRPLSKRQAYLAMPKRTNLPGRRGAPAPQADNGEAARRIARLGGWMLDHLSGRLSWSDEVFHLFETDAARFGGTYADFLATVHPEDREAVHRAFHDSLENCRPYEITHRLLMRDGRVKWLLEKCETEFDARGRPLCSHGMVQDVTEYQEALRALRASHETLTGILETTLDGYWCIDEKGRLLDVNPAYCRQSGYSREELVGMRISDLEAVESAADTAAHIHHVIECGCDLFETRHRRKDGSIWDVEVSTTYRRGSQGGLFFAFLRDITERKRADAELRIAAATFESHEGMMVTDADGVILRVNRAFTEITGYTAEEAVGKSPRLLKSDRHDAAFYRAMWETIATAGSWQGEIWDRRKNGEIYPKWLTITAIRDGRGVVTHYVGTHADITERKRAEDRIRRLAFYDTLTQLPNRRLLDDRLRHTLAASRRSGCHGALLFVDLDNFKPLNDVHGHALGDQLLVEAARRLRACVREMDTVARFGGDEFVVMLGQLMADREASRALAMSVAEKIRACLAAPYRLTAREDGAGESIVEHRCSASIGVALFADPCASPEEILRQADAAMYLAKQAGRDRIHCRSPEPVE